MKERISKLRNKKIHGISVLLLLIMGLLSVVGVAYAIFVLWTASYSITIEEPVSVQVTQDFASTVAPGETLLGEYKITNNSTSTPYDITFTFPENGIGNCTASASFVSSNGTLMDTIFINDTTGEVIFSLPASTSIPAGESNIALIELSIATFKDIEDGTLDFDVSIGRS